jgi:hypothetical protein
MLTDKGKSILLMLQRDKKNEEELRRQKQQKQDTEWAEARIEAFKTSLNLWNITLADGHTLALARRRLRAVLSLLGIPENEARKFWPDLVTLNLDSDFRYEFTLSKNDFIALLETSNKA